MSPLPSSRRLPAIAVPLGWLAAGVVLFLGFFYFFGGWRLRESADLTLCNSDEPQSLDPAIITGQLEERLCQALFEGLTTRNAKGVVIPGVAESWTLSPDLLTYTFTLRSNAKWSNGDPVTAADFLHSWERALNPRT